ncbi:hypothetical protein [Microbacterium aurantiacum]|uniref:hypothetical protein n=1 Tax=Microbacterium aurantiacum TaxID=162393 RepID=UPI000C80C083|nr:hypothetical protein [Microbacterium aurantiacum]
MTQSSAVTDTIVTFPAGGLRGDARILQIESRQDGAVIVLDATPFHPVDHTWPDQPGDTGALVSEAGRVLVTDTEMAARSDAGEFALGAEIPVRRGSEGWSWFVAHRIETADAPAWLAAGSTVVAEADAERRAALSRGHTACHLASLALDLALADLWRKDPGADALGSPDFEGRANQSSRIHDDGSVDEYRLGKSLRKAGFDTETFVATLVERQERINAQLAAWVASGARSRIEVDGPTIVDRRRWHCELPEGEAVILCGGTHVASLAEFSAISVSLDLSDPQLLVMTTTAVPAV